VALKIGVVVAPGETGVEDVFPKNTHIHIHKEIAE
jgi:hypothetical protein